MVISISFGCYSRGFYDFGTYWVGPPLSKHKCQQQVPINNLRNVNALIKQSQVSSFKECDTRSIEISGTALNMQHPSGHLTFNTSTDAMCTEYLAPIKLNLVPDSCNKEFTEWKQHNDINATVHHVLHPLATLSCTPMDLSDALLDNLPTLNLLSYAHVATTASNLEPSIANSNREVILMQSQMLKMPDRDSFIQSQKTEIEGLLKFDVIDIHPMQSLPRSSKLISSIWSYHRKHLPNGKLLKYKYRICVNGKDQSFGRDYWETYMPVTLWATIQMMLILSSILQLKSRQVDYTQAFSQALLDDIVYIRVPQDWYIHNGKLCQHENPNTMIHITI